MRVVGALVALAGTALTVYSIPFVTFVAFGFFLLGIVTAFLGIRLATGGHLW